MTVRPNSPAARDIATYLHPYTNLLKHEQEGPLIITRGNGVKVYDDAGKEYIEAMAGLWCASLGFSEKRLADAAYKQLQKLPYYHSFAHKQHDVSIDLAEKLLSMAPVPMSKVFFANSGSEANDTVVKMVWYFNNALGRHKKKKIISRLRGYHGVTVASASLTGLPNNHRDFDLPIANIIHTDCPHHYRYGQPGESEEAFATRMAENLEKLILAEGPDTCAAFIAEPVMGAGGVITPPATYFEKIQKVIEKYDLLFIADEVICGFGRTGNMFGSQTYALKPNMITLAKALTASYLPMSAVMIDERVYDALKRNSDKIGVFAHGYTYSGHPVAAAVGLETLKIYEERNIIDHVRRIAPKMQQGLRKFADHPLVGEVRGVGLVAAIELVKDKRTKDGFDPKKGVGSYLAKRCEAHGLIVRAMVDNIAFTPPLVITEAEIDEMLARFGRALDDTAAMVDAEKLRSVA
ncbi:MAG: aspartate aminotransferase family protein [Proteobacteria bacterium]|nr:aspartate aminotransferase family protein [Pseudomonadota bacterium]MBI3497268.1 aspartate aminotransferase family protein [Pseudomonadota bacterium]